MDVRHGGQNAVRTTGGANIPPVTLLLTTIAGLVVWIVLWSIGVKSFDAFLITITMIVLAATVQVFAPFLAGDRGDDQATAAGILANAALTQRSLRDFRRDD